MASSNRTSSSRSKTAPSTSRFANPHLHSSPRSSTPARPSSCKSRRSTSARSATWPFWSPCGTPPCIPEEEIAGSLGIGTPTNILGYHYGPGIESAERNGWGQWFRGDAQGIGMDRTVATGTGYIGQYPPELAKVYEDVNTCPDDLLLFMHHVPYTQLLHDGKTVVQFVYDAHYEGAATAQTYAPRWQTLKGLVDDERYEQTLKLFT